MKKLLIRTLSVLSFVAISANVPAQYFTPVWTGNPGPGAMSFAIINSTIDGNNLQAGDSVAVLDYISGELKCVGASIFSTFPMSFSAKKDDGSGNGFTEGHTIIYLIWDASASKIISLIDPDYYYAPPDYDSVYSPDNTADLLHLDGYSVNTWTGTTDNDWNTATNWDNGVLSNMFADVIIPDVSSGSGNYPNLTSSTGECNDITFQAGASILGNNNLTVNGTATFESDISNDQWHMVSSPMAGQTANVYYQGGTPKVYLTYYNEPNDGYTYIEDADTALTDMLGYMLWMNSVRSTTVTYSGTTLNSGTFGSANNLTRDGSTYPGWNMVGNPYPSSIDWDAGSGWTKTDVDDAIYVINNGSFDSYIGGVGTGDLTQYIAPGQAFFVRVASGHTTGTLQMNDDVRVNNNTTFLKNKAVTDYVKLSVSSAFRTNETVVRFKNEATANFDGQYDAYKRFATNKEIPQIYTYSDEDYSINSLPFTESVNMGFTCSLDGDYSISIVEIDGIDNIWLEDLLTGDKTDLKKSSYTFNHLADENPERFVLHFSPLSVYENQSDLFTVFAWKSVINVKSSSVLSGDVSVYNILGQIVANEIMNDGQCKIYMNKQGYYLVKVSTENNIVTRKVFVE